MDVLPFRKTYAIKESSAYLLSNIQSMMQMTLPIAKPATNENENPMIAIIGKPPCLYYSGTPRKSILSPLSIIDIRGDSTPFPVTSCFFI